jgi:hypothetical protein
MLELEANPTLAVRHPRLAAEAAPALEARAAVISEVFSFGKTVLCLALVCVGRAPARRTVLAPLLSHDVARNVNRALVVVDDRAGGGGAHGASCPSSSAASFSRVAASSADCRARCACSS